MIPQRAKTSIPFYFPNFYYINSLDVFFVLPYHYRQYTLLSILFWLGFESFLKNVSFRKILRKRQLIERAISYPLMLDWKSSFSCSFFFFQKIKNAVNWTVKPGQKRLNQARIGYIDIKRYFRAIYLHKWVKE